MGELEMRAAVMILITIAMITALSACEFNWDERNYCYNIRLNYTLYRTGKVNELPDYVHTMHYLLFDGDGVLMLMSDTTGTAIAHKDLNLNPGEYTMVTWGNLDKSCYATPPVCGVTRLEELSLENTGDGKNTEKLYFSSRAFTVTDAAPTIESIEMTHAHALLRITVKWEAFYPPIANDWSLRMRRVPACYGHRVGQQVEDYPQINTRASGTGGRLIYTIPEVKEERLSDHVAPAYTHPRGYVYGELISFRHTNNTHQLISLWKGDEQQMKEIDLNRFFTTMNIDLDRNLRQEFDLTFTIKDSGVGVALTEVADWADGGDIGD